MKKNDQIIAMRQEGMSYSQIAQALGIAKGTVASCCRRMKMSVEKTEVKRCDQCGQALTTSSQSYKKRFCSDACRMAYWKAHPEGVARKAFYSLTCATCGQTFKVYGAAKQKYCSSKCYGIARSAQHG